MTEIGERVAKLETQMEAVKDIENRLRRMERWQALAIGALLALQVVGRFFKLL